MLYIATAQADPLSAADMTLIRNWTAAGGTLVINNHTNTTGGFSEFGASFGPTYEFTAISESGGNNIDVTDAMSPVLNFPNVLDNAALSNWGSSTHGAFGSPGSAYSCAVDSVNGSNRTAVLCTASFSLGSIILTGFDPECGCHDNHLTGGTHSGSELWENFVMFNGTAKAATSVPALSDWTITLLATLFALLGIVHFRRRLFV